MGLCECRVTCRWLFNVAEAVELTSKDTLTHVFFQVSFLS